MIEKFCIIKWRRKASMHADYLFRQEKTKNVIIANLMIGLFFSYSL